MKINWKIKMFWHQITGIIPSCILCIRFPFLYPRNRFTGKHYNNWHIIEKQRELNDKYHKVTFEDKSAEGGSRFDKTEDRWTSPWRHFQYRGLGWLHSFLSIFHAIPWYTELDGMPDGWRKAFGIQICKEIKHELYKTGGRKAVLAYRIDDIKEKYGSLRWYDSHTTMGVQKVIEKYAYISEHTCVVCGEMATCTTPLEYWKCPYCDEHAPKQSKYLIDFGMKENPWYGLVGNINGRSSEEWEEKKKLYEDYIKLRDGEDDGGGN